LELKCLQAIWQLGEANVKDVRDIVTKDRKLAYTTVMTTLDRLEKKGTLKRKKSGKAFVYSAAMTESELRQLAVQHLLDEYFAGSRDSLLAYLQGFDAAPSVAVPSNQQAPPRLDPSLL
jgi:BlaI family transcriptional regulator, penicillinase repressor